MKQRTKWRSRAYRFGWYYGRELKTFGEPPRPVLYALGVLLLPVALVFGAIWLIVIRPTLAIVRRFTKGS
jgi:hypothetical protein